jgi:hypothetical protein
MSASPAVPPPRSSKTGTQVLPRGRRAASDADVLPGGRLERPLERSLDPVRDEVERRPAVHLEGRARVVGQDEDRVVVRRVVAPPAAPVLVAPGPAHRAEHVPAHDHRADVLAPGRGPLVVEARRAPLAPPVQLAPAARLDYPGVERLGALPERVLEALVGPGDVPVQRHRDVQPELRHRAHRPGAPTPSAARSSSAMSSLPICSIAATARWARSGSGSAISSYMRLGTICHDRP